MDGASPHRLRMGHKRGVSRRRGGCYVGIHRTAGVAASSARLAVFVLGGLTLIGIAIARGKPIRGMGGLVLAMGTLEGGYYLTNAGDVLEHRTAHDGFGLLFALGWLVLGVWLLVAGTRRA